MATPKIQLANKNKLIADLRKIAGDTDMLGFWLNRAALKAEPKILNELQKAWRRTEVYRGLIRGNTRSEFTDIVAILGLEEAVVDSFLELMDTIFTDNIQILNTNFRVNNKPVKSYSQITGTSGGSVNITITARSAAALVRQEAESLGVGAYISENKKGEQTLVPWLKWLLDGVSLDASLVYGVKFKSSRTGRAYMEVGYNTSGNPAFDIDDYNRFATSNEEGEYGKNFLNDIAKDTVLLEAVADILNEELARVLRQESYRIK